MLEDETAVDEIELLVTPVSRSPSPSQLWGNRYRPSVCAVMGRFCQDGICPR